ncbi:uncharacterized protein LOC131668741 [Phymastichus coffea]|uniref:uncharacterized protein LOC131668741 n=1 Tax=Phymastichus coffea TaxID=108790 RepID=UPI00273AB3E5|nr:uncharacterized protein LOC131668741 [Phymastichus coffea]XP_058799133.1 uncharacterized protein LOC131668741 [Phymastichus coffea]
MPAKYVSPDHDDCTLTTDQIRRRYRDTSLVIFQEQYLYRARRVRESERERTTYLSFGVNRRAVTYNNNGNEPVIVHRTVTDAVMQANPSSRFLSRIIRAYEKPSDNCTIS